MKATNAAERSERLNELARLAPRFEFLPLVRRLEAILEAQDLIGTDASPEREPFRFDPDPDLSFPASPVSRIIVDRTGRDAPRIRTTFLSLYGFVGTLPQFYREILGWRQTEGSRAFKAFLDIFNHRVISLYYRALTKYRIAYGWRDRGRSLVRQCLLSVIGQGTRGLVDRLAIDDVRLLPHVGLLSHRPRTASGLRTIVGSMFPDVEVRVEPFCRVRHIISGSSRGRLGEGRLGSFVVGSAVVTRATTFAVRLGPLSWKRLLGFLPGARDYRALWQVVRFYVGSDFDFEIRLGIREKDVPPLELGSPNVRLGQTTWIAPGDSDRVLWNCTLRGDFWQLVDSREHQDE